MSSVAGSPSIGDGSSPGHGAGAWQAATVCFTELRRAWSMLHRAGAPELSWEQRLLLLTGLFEERSSAWVVALEARLRALEAQMALLGKPPTEEAFKQAAQAQLQARGSDFRFAPGSCCW